jgi:hypothetical protein
MLIILEIIANIWWVEFRGCLLKDSDVYDDVDLKKKLCLDWYEVIIYQEPTLMIEPNQKFESISINDKGIRGMDFTEYPDKNTSRIFMVGGSTTFGVGSTSDNTSIPGYLQEIFDIRILNQNFEVINAGIPSANSKTESNLIENYLANFHPDVIIVYDGWNDLMQSTNTFEKPIITSYNIKKDKTLTENIFIFSQKYFPFYKTPIGLKHIFTAFTYHEKEELAYESNIDTMVSEWSKTWTNVCLNAKDNDIKTIIILQPFLGTGNKILSDSESIILKKFNEHKNAIKYYEKYASTLDDLALKCDVVLDFRMVFDEKKNSIFYDRVHVGDEGNYIVAEEIFSHLQFIIHE